MSSISDGREPVGLTGEAFYFTKSDGKKGGLRKGRKKAQKNKMFCQGRFSNDWGMKKRNMES